MTWDLLTHFKDIKSDLREALNDKEGTTKTDDDLYGFDDMVVVSSKLKNKSSDYSPDRPASKNKKSDIFKSAKVTSSASQIDDESNGFIDMVKSPTLLSKSSDYSGDSEDKQSKFSGSKDQGKFGLCSYKSTYMYMHIICHIYTYIC